MPFSVVLPPPVAMKLSMLLTAGSVVSPEKFRVRSLLAPLRPPTMLSVVPVSVVSPPSVAAEL